MRRILPQALLFAGLLLSGFSFAGEEASGLTESKVCAYTNKSFEECRPEDRYLKKALTRDGREVYIESYDISGKQLLGISLSPTPNIQVSCYQDEKKMRCEHIEIGHPKAVSASKRYSVYRSDEELAKAMGVALSDIAALEIDWDYTQAVVWETSAPKSAHFVVTRGSAFFETTKGKSGRLILPFYESCPHGGIPGSEATPAPERNIVVALIPSYFSITGAKAQLAKAGFPPEACGRIPSAPR